MTIILLNDHQVAVCIDILSHVERVRKILGDSEIIALEEPQMKRKTDHLDSVAEGEENFVGDSEIIALGGASNETKDRPLG